MPEIITPTGALIVWAVAGYLLGSIPFGMIVARVMGLGNLRNIGSGNIGATNVLRTGNKKAAALTLLFDAGKGAVIVLLARAMASKMRRNLQALPRFLVTVFQSGLSLRAAKVWPLTSDF